MNTYNNCLYLRQFILSQVGEVMNYTHWSDEFSANEIRKIHAKIGGMISVINVTELTKEQMDNLGFKRWEEGGELMLIPLWLYQFLPDDISVISINGEVVVGKANIDTDARFGCLAFGVIPANEKVD